MSERDRFAATLFIVAAPSGAGKTSLVKALVFPSSLIFLKLLLTFVTYLDILRLPLTMERRVDLIGAHRARQTVVCR